MTDSLEWYDRLHPKEQISLLRDPHQNLHGDLAKRLVLAKEAYGSHWTSNDGGATWSLLPEAASKLSAIKAQFDEWWGKLDTDQQEHIIENRAGELDRDYRDVVQGASPGQLTDTSHQHVVIVASDNATGRFRLPTMVRNYVELKV